MRPPGRILVAILACCAAISGLARGPDGGRGQTERPASSQVIKVQVRLVPVDVIVTDDKNRPVTDLKREDFRISEDGRLQEIRHFALQTYASAAEPERPAAAPPPPGAPAPQTARTFLIVMGRGRYVVFKTLESLMQFLRKDLLPQDRVAFMAFNRATDFTTDHEGIARVIERFKREHEWVEAAEAQRLSGLAGIFGSKDWSKETQKHVDRIFDAAAGVASRQLAPSQVPDKKKMDKDAAQAAGTLIVKEAVDQAAAAGDPGAALRQSMMQFDVLAANAITNLPFSEFASSFGATMQSTQNIYTSIDYMRFMEGEKRLLFFTPTGLDLPRVEYDERLAAYANDARVAIDTFQTGGCCPPPEWLASLRNISTLTGGRATIVDYAGKGLARINETTRAEYLLGYYPANANWDGRYRRIDVKVNRPGVRVSFRHGYFARESPPVLNLAEMRSVRRISAAGAYATEVRDVPFEVNACVDPFGPQQVRVDIRIRPENVELTHLNGRYTGQLRVTVYYADSRGRYLGEAWKNVNFNLTEPTYLVCAGPGIPVTIMIPLKAKKQIIKVVIYDPHRDRLGSQLVRLQ